MELPPLSSRQHTPEQAAQVAELRTSVEETHKVRTQLAAAFDPSVTLAERGDRRGARAAQSMQQLSTEKVRLAATAGDLVRNARTTHVAALAPRAWKCPTPRRAPRQVSGYIRTLDKDLAVFADELLAQAREAEAAALAAQAQRYDPGPPAAVRPRPRAAARPGARAPELNVPGVPAVRRWAARRRTGCRTHTRICMPTHTHTCRSRRTTRAAACTRQTLRRCTRRRRPRITRCRRRRTGHHAQTTTQATGARSLAACALETAMTAPGVRVRLSGTSGAGSWRWANKLQRTRPRLARTGSSQPSLASARVRAAAWHARAL
jgi:hypothetical protein